MSLFLRKFNFYNGEINYFVKGQSRYLYPMNVAHCQICSVAGWEADLINIASNGLSNITLLDSLHHGIPPLDSLHHGFCNPWDATNNRNPSQRTGNQSMGNRKPKTETRNPFTTESKHRSLWMLWPWEDFNRHTRSSQRTGNQRTGNHNPKTETRNPVLDRI